MNINTTDNGFEKGIAVAENAPRETRRAAKALARRLMRQAVQQLQNMRTVYIIGLGGMGHLIALYLKATLVLRFGDAWQERIRIQVFDTTDEPQVVQVAGRTVTLEADSEFFHIGHVPVSRIQYNIERLPAIAQRMGPAMNRLPATAMRGNGAKSSRLLGLLALEWHFGLIERQLRHTIRALTDRELHADTDNGQQHGLSVFVLHGLGGGTGSGAFIDVANLVRHFVAESGEQGQFCTITGIGILPQAFVDVQAPNLYPNTGAALEELHHLMLRGNFEAEYPGGRRVAVTGAPFDLYYVIDGVDENGFTWRSLDKVAQMAAEGVFLQMASQLGQKGENAFDNLDEVLVEQTRSGDLCFLSSFGQAYMVFPAPAVVDWCGRRLMATTARRSWLRPAAVEAALDTAAGLLSAAATSQLGPRMLRSEAGGEIGIALNQPGWLAERAASEAARAAIHYVSEYGRARVADEYMPQVMQNASAVGQALQQEWQSWIEADLFAANGSLHQSEQVLQQAQAVLAGWLQSSGQQLERTADERERRERAKESAERNMLGVADSFPLGRQGRMQKALFQYFQVAREYYRLQLEEAHLRAQRQVWRDLATHLTNLAQTVQLLAGNVETVIGRVESTLDRELEALEKGGVATISLAGADYVRELYEAHAPASVHLWALFQATGDEAGVPSPLKLAELNTRALEERLLAGLRVPFSPLEELDVEQVIAARAEDMSATARRQQLFRLATPSWSIDRTRLHQGGAGLARVEVMGVPNAAESLFAGQGTLVSTHDPYRLVALVVVAGAPLQALQQYERLKQAVEETRGRRPLYVLPQFMTGTSQARLAFALGSLFGFIYNQGTYFYYQPADELQAARRLGNGLANAIAALEEEEPLVREIMERVDGQIARLGLHQAIQRLTEYYEIPPKEAKALDELSRELKQLVREYAGELRGIEEFSRVMRG